MKELMNTLTLAQIIKTAKFIGEPTKVEVLEEGLKDLEAYPSNYNLGIVLKEIGDMLMDN